MAWFDGNEAEVERSEGATNVYYGGRRGDALGDGHGHVEAVDGPLGESIVYWRLPANVGGQVIVNNPADIMYGTNLSEYLSDF